MLHDVHVIQKQKQQECVSELVVRGTGRQITRALNCFF